MSVIDRIQQSRERGYPLIMGVLNVTPDSFFDGGRYLAHGAARRRVVELLEQGAEIIDIGAESSRPGALKVDADEQLKRMKFALAACVEHRALVSVDTTSPRVADHALTNGARIVNDISCLADPVLAEVVARHNAWLVLTHNRKPMIEMSGFSQWPEDDYADIVEEVMSDWGTAKQRAIDGGIRSDQLIFDPGLGFCKSARHSLAVLSKLEAFLALGAPILVGASRKSFIHYVDPSNAEERLGGSLAAALVAAEHGADIVRVHDIQATRQALKVWAASRRQGATRASEARSDAPAHRRSVE